ncbi:P-II family nitrogen regulator [Portibacter lacus]|nr:P-II family nitrogen regulator [Portibacter lacus]
MKKIEAIIRSSKFDDVKDALAAIHVDFFTFMEVKGFGKQKGEQVVYRGAVYDVGYIARMKLDIYSKDDDCEEIVNIIMDSAKTGEIGDGKVIVTDISEMWSVRLGTKNESAL